MLRELGNEGKVEGRRKKLHQAGTLPPVVLADVTERDHDGELLAVPTEWDDEAHGDGAAIRLHVPRKARPAKSPASATACLLRIEESGEDGDAIRHSGRVIKVLDRAKRQRQLGVFRALPNGGGRLVPVEQEASSGARSTIPPGATDGRAGRRSGRGRTHPQGRFGLPTRAREGDARLDQERARGQPDRDPRA